MKTISSSLLLVVAATAVMMMLSVVNASYSISNDNYGPSDNTCSGGSPSSNPITPYGCLSEASCGGGGGRRSTTSCGGYYHYVLLGDKIEYRHFTDSSACSAGTTYTVDSSLTYDIDTCILIDSNYIKFTVSGATTTTAAPGAAGSVQGFVVASVAMLVAVMMMMMI